MSAEAAAEATGSRSPGFLITVEGGDGAGKSTLARTLALHFESGGWTVRLTSEPGGSELGQRLRRLVLDPQLSLSDWEETWLFLAARASHVRDVVRPALNRGELVLCDRFSDSTLAYQGYGRGLDLERLQQLNQLATEGLRPDLVVLLDVSVEVGLARARARSEQADRIGDEEQAFHQRVNAGFRQLAERDPERFLVMDADRSAVEVEAESASRVAEWLDAAVRGRTLTQG